MNKYYVVWMYIANYGTMEVEAEDPQNAAAQVVAGFSEDFKLKGRVEVFEQKPVHVYDGRLVPKEKK